MMLKKLFLIGIVCVGCAVYFIDALPIHAEQRDWFPKGYNKSLSLTVIDDGVEYVYTTKKRTIEDFLQDINIVLHKDDIVTLDTKSAITPDMKIHIFRAKHITLDIENKKHKVITYQTEMERVFLENNFTLDADDMILPLNTAVVDNADAALVRVEISEKIINKPIEHNEISEEDATIGWRKKMITQKGVDGLERLTYKVVKHNGEEISSQIQEREIIKEPVVQKIVKGTKIELGKSHTGLGSWYAYTGTLSAASPWLPKGSSVKVTNQDNGKSVIVTINDRGPFGKNRILDLDKVAFSEIASVGAGIIPIKVEEIIN